MKMRWVACAREVSTSDADVASGVWVAMGSWELAMPTRRSERGSGGRPSVVAIVRCVVVASYRDNAMR